jgi:hypothetical protein
MSIWLPTTKSQESPWIMCMQVMCNILLKSSRKRIQLFFKPHLNRRFAQEITSLQSFWNPNFGNFETPTSKTKWHLGTAPMANHKEYYKGKMVASLKSEPWWVLWVRVCPWLVCVLKMFQLCTNQLVIWFVQVRVNSWLACHSS